METYAAHIRIMTVQQVKVAGKSLIEETELVWKPEFVAESIEAAMDKAREMRDCQTSTFANGRSWAVLDEVQVIG